MAIAAGTYLICFRALKARRATDGEITAPKIKLLQKEIGAIEFEERFKEVIFEIHSRPDKGRISNEFFKTRLRLLALDNIGKKHNRLRMLREMPLGGIVGKKLA